MKGAQDTLPFIGTMTSIQLEEEDMAYMESEDLQSAFNLFAAPDQWLPYFADSKKVDGPAFGLASGTMVRPALAVIPMGWHSAVGLVQEAVRTLVFERAQVPKSLSIEKGKPLPQSDTKASTISMRSTWSRSCQRTSQRKGARCLNTTRGLWCFRGMQGSNSSTHMQVGFKEAFWTARKVY